MKVSLRLLMVLAVAGALTGCVTTNEAEVWKNPRGNQSRELSYRLGEFKNINSKEDKDKFPEANEVIRESLETAFLRSGCRIITEGQADAIITGTVREYYRGSFAGRYTTVGFDVKAESSDSNEILWKASHSITTGWDYKYSPSLLADRVAQELVQQLIEK